MYVPVWKLAQNTVYNSFFNFTAFAQGSCPSPFSQYSSLCLNLSPDAGLKNHYNARDHCTMNGGQLPYLANSASYRAGKYKYKRNMLTSYIVLFLGFHYIFNCLIVIKLFWLIYQPENVLRDITDTLCSRSHYFWITPIILCLIYQPENTHNMQKRAFCQEVRAAPGPIWVSFQKSVEPSPDSMEPSVSNGLHNKTNTLP